MPARSPRPTPRLALPLLLSLGLWSCADAGTPPNVDAEANADEANPTTTSESRNAGFTLPQPDGWRTETFSFPLPFASDLPYRGVEEIRFAPGWSDPQAEDFWSYLFIWWIDPAGEVTTEVLEEHLEQYFRGLASGGEVDAQTVQNEVQARLEPFRPAAPGPADGVSGRGAQSLGVQSVGVVRIVDTFATQAPLDLRVEVQRRSCPGSERELWVFSWSPQPRDHAIWPQLDAIREGADCG